MARKVDDRALQIILSAKTIRELRMLAILLDRRAQVLARMKIEELIEEHRVIIDKAMAVAVE